MRILILALTVCSFSALGLDEIAFKERNFDVPMREQAVIITSEGYYPQKLTIFEGEKIHFFVTSTNQGRGSCLLMPSHKLYISVPEGKMAEGDAYFDTPGHYTFYCPAGKIKGEIVVLKRPHLEADQAEREIASVKKVQVWRPREE